MGIGLYAFQRDRRSTYDVTTYHRVRTSASDWNTEMVRRRRYIRRIRFSSGRGYVYVLKSPSRGLIKVGVTANPRRRLLDLRRNCQIPDLEMRYKTRELRNAVSIEGLVHQQLDRYREIQNCNHGGGRLISHQEWYRCSARLARAVIRRTAMSVRTWQSIAD